MEGSRLAKSDDFAIDVINFQSRLSAYVYSLVLNEEATREILQRTNVVLLEKQDEYEAGTNFTAWAFRIAYYEILAVRRDYRRNRLLYDDELLSALAVTGESVMENTDDRLDALLQCLAALPEEQREVILQRYEPGGSVKRIAEKLKRTPAAISNILYRVRSQLLNCVRSKTADSSHQ